MLDGEGNLDGKIINSNMTMLDLSSCKVSWDVSVNLRFHAVRRQTSQMLVWGL